MTPNRDMPMNVYRMRKANAARRVRGRWTQEEIDYINRSSVELAKKMQAYWD